MVIVSQIIDIVQKYSIRRTTQSNKDYSMRRSAKPVRASFSPVSISGMLGTNTPGVSKTYMLGRCAICETNNQLQYLKLERTVKEHTGKVKNYFTYKQTMKIKIMSIWNLELETRRNLETLTS